jgi:hypothetical protein
VGVVLLLVLVVIIVCVYLYFFCCVCVCVMSVVVVVVLSLSLCCRLVCLNSSTHARPHVHVPCSKSAIHTCQSQSRFFFFLWR